MAANQSQAWITWVPNDDAVTGALVLAGSLRRNRTTKRIGAIVGEDVTKAGRKSLQTDFDDLFGIGDSPIPPSNGKGKVEDYELLRAQVFAVSLKIYKKCIFIPSNTLIAKNMDDMFQDDKILPEIEENLESPMELLVYKPSRVLSSFLATKLESSPDTTGNFIMTCVKQWNENNRPVVQPSDLTFCSVPAAMKLSVAKGQLVKVGQKFCGQPDMIHFVDVPSKSEEMVEQMKFLRMSKLGVADKAVVENWLEVFEGRVASLLMNPHSVQEWDEKENMYENEPIAIIGMSCRLPGANSVEEFWNLLYSGDEGVRHPPPFRWRKEQSIYGGSGMERKTEAGFLSVPVDEFDAKFFGISPKEAASMDPQARLLHELLWEGLENSGIDPLALHGTRAGVFTGSWINDYKDIIQMSTERDFFRTYMGNSMGATAARLSFLLGLTGPNISTESGCSSAMVAVDLAVKSLRNGESTMALVGGVNLLLHPFKADIMDHIVAQDGRCKTFDEKADGFGRAEGCAVLVMKKLSDALRDGDNIWGMIRGSAISQEGISRSLGTPTAHCEALAMTLALKDAGVRPEDVSFVETHGTGTVVGDSMEVAAMANAYHTPARKEPLIIGSVKTNVGHTESCSGITGIIKTILSMQHEIIPKHLNLETLSPDLNLDAIPAKIPVEALPWPKVEGQPRLAGVSSFGITGTDGHVIVEEAPTYNLPNLTMDLERPLHFIKFSGKTTEALDDLLKQYQETFQQNQEAIKFADVAFSANMGRASFGNRAFLLASNYEEAIHSIQSGKLVRGETSGAEPGKICFLFTGQGSQYPGMAKTLYETSPVFRVHFDQCDRILTEKYRLSIRDVLWGSEDNSKELSRTIYSQTSIFCVEYCLLKLWESWGIKPDFVLGHSLGEFGAAVAAGVLSFEDALKLVAERSRLIDNLPRGSMLVIKSSKTEVEKLLKKSNMELDFAAVNSHEQTVVAGDSSKISWFLEVCKEQGLKAIVLQASHAFHSRHMDPMLEQYRRIAETVRYSKKTSCQYISGMEGRVLKDPSSEINADYWVRHTREKVSFLDACKTLRQLDCQHFLEVGPQPVLSGFVMQNIEDVPVSTYPSLRRNTPEWETILTSLGKLYLQGFKVDWSGFDMPYARKKVPSSLPLHPFYRKAFWTDCSDVDSSPLHPLIGFQFKNASSVNIFQNNLSLKMAPYLRDHCIGSRIVMPGAGFTEMCLAAGYCVANSLTDTLETLRWPIAVENVSIESPLEIKEDSSCRLQLIVDLQENDDLQHHFRVKVLRRNNADNESTGKWVTHASSTFHPVTDTKDILSTWNAEMVKDLLDHFEGVPTTAFYDKIDAVGLKFGDGFKSISKCWRNEQQNEDEENNVVAEVKLPRDYENYLLHPILIDAMIQMNVLALQETQEALFVPLRVGKLILLENIPMGSDKLYLHARWGKDGQCKIFAVTENLTPVAFMSDVQLIETNVKTMESVLQQQVKILPDCWEEAWIPVPGPMDNLTVQVNKEAVVSNKDLQEKLKAINYSGTPESKENFHKTERLIYLYTLDALFKMGWKPYTGERIFVKEFCEKFSIQAKHTQLVRFYFAMFAEEAGIVEILREDVKNGGEVWVVKQVVPDYTRVLEAEVEQLYDGHLKNEKSVNVNVNLYRHLGSYLPEILSGQKSVLSILFPSEFESSGDGGNGQEFSAETYYLNHPGRAEASAKATAMIAEIVRQTLAANQSGDGTTTKVFRILEAGAGTGVMAAETLELIEGIWGAQYEYYFTDISPSFFAKAEKLLEKYKGNLKFRAFNIEEFPLEQGIPLNYFDVVFACDVLHATKNLKECVSNLRQTMRPHGTFFFTDTMTQERCITFAFGLLEGYWCFEDFDWRPHHACVNADTWKRLLQQTGYDYVHSTAVHHGTLGCITAEASSSNGYDLLDTDAAITRVNPPKWIIFAPDTEQSIDKVASVISNNGCGVTLVKYSQDMKDDTKLEAIVKSTLDCGQVQGVVYAWGMDKDLQDQSRISRPLLHVAKSILNMKKPARLYVFTRGVHAINESQVDLNPSAATLFGMLKSLKNENADLVLRYVDLESGSDLESTVNSILYDLAMFKESKERERIQVAYRDNSRYEPRFKRAVIPHNPLEDDLKLPPCTDRYQLVLPESRMISDLSFDILEPQPVGDDQVEVITKAYALNFKDILTIIKPTKEFENMTAVGLDWAGVVSKVGKTVDPAKVKVGDRVFGASVELGQLPSHTVMDAVLVKKIPERMTICEAAAIPMVFLTAIHCLINVAKMKKGETVLIHTGSGGVGLSAIQVAKYIGANIITTAGSPRKRAYLKSLGIEHIFHSRNTSYKEDILRVTNGRGVDIVLNSLTSPGFKEATLDVCAKNARFVEMSKLAVWSEEEVRQLRPDVDYSIVYLGDLSKLEWKELLDSVDVFMAEGHLCAIPCVQFDALRLRQAFNYFQKAKHIGKVVVTMPEIKAKVGQWTVSVPLFNAQSTYLITGGLGGIGLEVCKWMLERGATDIALVGRNPPKPEVAREIETLNREKGFNVTVQLADVGNYAQIKAVIDDIVQNGKPIRGIHHCAGVLRDNFMANQTWDAFEHTFNPKVAGTWNLHNLTKDMLLEHFVFYSSITALVGTPSQANHAAANCFEDAFGHYRQSLGLPATVINWGQWAQVGIAKDVNLPGITPVSVKRMMNGLEAVFRNQREQISFGEFESMATWTLTAPMFKSYMDERLIKSMKDGIGSGGQAQLKSDTFWKEMDEAPTKAEKITIFCAYLKVIIRAALRMDADEAINEDSGMQELGVDSLMSIELKNSIQSLLGSRVTVNANMFKDCVTIRDMATVIVNKICDDEQETESVQPLSPEEFAVLLEKDCVLEESVQPPTPVTGSVGTMKSVLVTGVTGQLGPYILSTLSQPAYHHLEKIICLIRTREGKCPRERLENVLKSMDLSEQIDMGRVECLRGDVTLPNFGLAKEEYDHLCQSVDGVVHLAVKSNHVESYQKVEKGARDIRSVNVGGTLNVLRFASTEKTKRIYYASSLLCVFGGKEQSSLHDDWPEESEIKVIAENNMMGYATAKWVSEMLLKQANERGIPTKVFRFPYITGDSKTGRLNYMNNHYILRFLSYLKIKEMPMVPVPFLVLPVDQCAEVSLSLFFNPDAPNEVYNITHPSPQLEVEFAGFAKEEYATSIELVENWQEGPTLEKLYQKGMPLESLQEVYQDMDRLNAILTSDAFQAVQGYLRSPDTYFSNAKVSKFVPDFCSNFESTIEIVRKNLAYVKSQGFFDKFGL